MGKIYVGDVGTVLLVDAGEDVSSANPISLMVKKPDGTVVEWLGTGVGNQLSYTTVAGDADQEGMYLCQIHATLGGWVGRGQTFGLQIYAAFA